MSWVVSGPLMVVFACMVFLTSQKTGEPGKTPQQQAREPDWEEGLRPRIDALTQALERSGVELPTPAEERKGSGALRWIHRRYDVPASTEEEAAAEESLAALRLVDAGVTVTSMPRFDGVDVQVGLDGLLTHTVRFRWREQEQRPRVALVIAPLGDDLRMARECVSLDAPIAIAVEPFRPFSKEVAELGRLFDREILVYLAPTPGDAGSDSALSAKLKEALDAVPNAIGVTGGEGSSRADAELRGKIGEEVNRLGLFHIWTQPAEGQGTGPAIIMLNSKQLTEPLADQFAKLIAKARAVGAVVGVSRPSHEILSILPQQLSEWQAGGVEVVPVSKLAVPTGLSAG
jgi:polysaccharide deacetylase 2 family uncharacterized protein YibQ